MPNYLVELEDGRKFQVEADTPPTREELSQYLAEQQSTQSAVPQAKKDLPFLDITDVASSLGQAATSLATTVPASFGQMYEGTMNPWQKGADSIERQKAMRDVQRQAELSQAEAEASGEASIASRAIRSGIPSYGFTGAIMPPSLIAGGVTGLATAAATRNPVAAQRAAMAAGTAASGYAAYRMASAQFLDDARERIDNFFLEKAGRLPNEQEQEEAYQELLPLAQEMGMAEALPEAFGNLALAGAGKYIYRILGGKTGVQQLASGALSKVKGLDALKSVGAGVAGTGAELTTEGVTEVLQESPYTKLEEGVMRGAPVESVQTEPFTLQRLGEGIERVAEPTLATTFLMGGLGAVGTAGYRRATRKDFEQNDFRDKMIQQAVTARRAMTDAGVTETDKTNLTNRAEEAEAALKALDEGRSSDVEKYFNVRLVKPAVSPAIDVANKLNSVSSSNPDATQAAAAAQADIDKANADADAKRVADEQAAAVAAVTAPTPITLAPEPEPIAEPPPPSPLTGQPTALPVGTVTPTTPIQDATQQIPLEESVRQELQDRVEVRTPEETGVGDSLLRPARGEEEEVDRGVALPPPPEGVDSDIIDYILGNWSIESVGKTQRDKRRTTGEVEAFERLKQGLLFPARNILFSPDRGRNLNRGNLDVIAQAAFERNLIPAPDANALTDEILKAYNARKSGKSPFAEMRQQEEAAEQRTLEFEKAARERTAPLTLMPASDLEIGDVVQVGDDNMRVTFEYDEDGYPTATILTGPKFGEQRVDPNKPLKAEKLDTTNRVQATSEFVPEAELEGAIPEAPPPSPNLPALIAVRDNTATPEQVQSLVDQGLVERVGDQNIITEAGVAAMPEGEKPKLTPAERAAEVEGMAAPVVRDVTKPEQMTPEELAQDLRQAGINPEAKPEKGNTSERTLSAAIQRSAIESAVLEFNGFKPVSSAAVDTYGITLPEGYVKQGELYVFQPEAPAAQPPAAEPVTPEAEAQQDKDAKEAKKLENESRASLARLVAGERGNPVFGNVTMDDGIEALRQLDEAGDLPNIFFTEITTTQEFLSKPENEQNFPDTWAALSAGGKAEGMEEKGTAFVFIDNVGVTNLDRKLATQFGTTPEVAAVRRVATHESIHKAISFLNESEQIALFRYMRELYSPEQLDVLAETYTNFANWRESKSSYLNLIEESLTRTIDSMDSLPKDGILGEFIQWLKGIWRKITGKKGEPTLNDMKDVMRLIRNGLRNSTKARADRTISGGVVRYSAVEKNVTITTRISENYGIISRASNSLSEEIGGGIYQKLSESDNSPRAQAIRRAAAIENWNELEADAKNTALSDFAASIAPSFVQSADSLGIRFATARTNAGRSFATYARNPVGGIYPIDVIFDFGSIVGQSNDPVMLFTFAFDTANEEAIHAIQKYNTQQRFLQGGGVGNPTFFEMDYYNRMLNEVINSSEESPDAFRKISNAILRSVNSYYNKNFTNVNEAIGSLKNAPEMAAYMMELSRQLVQVNRSDFTSETGYMKFYDALKAIMDDILNALRALLNMAKAGDVGYLLKQEIADIERFLSDLRTPQAPATDAEYLAAVEAGDMEKAQRMVDEAANGVGFNINAFHGTPSGGFNSFTPSERGLFFVNKPEIAETYTYKRGIFLSKGKNPQVFAVKLKLTNPLTINALGNRWDNIPFPGETWKPKVFGNLPSGAINVNEAVKKAFAAGYDGVIIENVMDSVSQQDRTKATVYAAANPSQIKSADPVTRDDQGRIIPLSQRFQTTSPDIRFSLPTLVSESASAFSSGQQAARAISFTPRQLDVYMAVLGAFSTLRRKGKQSATMQELFDAANTLVSGITPNEFSETLQGLYNDNAALLNPGDSTFQVFNRDGELAGAVVLVAKDTLRASLIPPEEIKGITDKLTSDMDKAVTEGEQSPFEGLSFTGNVPKMHARVNFRNVEKAAEDFVNQMIRSRKEKGRTYIEALIDIADMVATDNFAKEYIGGAGMESQGLVLQAVPPPLNNKIYAAQMTNISEADRVRLEDAYRKVSLYYEGIGTVGGTLQGYRAWTATRGKYGWLLDSWKADALKTAEYAVNAQMGGSVSVKINQDLNDAVTGVGKAVADEVSGMVEEDQDAIDLAAGEATLEDPEKSLYEEYKDILRRRGILDILDKRDASAAKASISSEERNALAKLTKAGRDEMRKKDDKRRMEILAKLLGKEEDAKTPEQKKTRKKREKMVKAAEKIIFREGKDVEFRKTSAQEAVADLFNGADEYGKIVEEVGNALLARTKQAKGMTRGPTAIRQLVQSIKQTLLANLPPPKAPPSTNATLGKMLAMTFSQQIREARLYADAWSKGRTEVRNLLAETGLEGEALENELDAIMPPTPTLAYAPNAAKRAIALAMEQAGVTREELTDARVNVSNEAKAKVMAAFDAAAAAANLSTEGWNTQGATGRQLAERALNEAAQQWIIQASNRVKISSIVAEQADNPVSIEAFTKKLSQFNLTPKQVKRYFDIAARAAVRRVEINNEKAKRIIYERGDIRPDVAEKDVDGDTVIEAFRDQVNSPTEEQAFLERLSKLRVAENVAKDLFNTAARERRDRQRTRVFDMIEGKNAIQRMLREIALARRGIEMPLRNPIPWTELLSKPAKSVDEYRQRVLDGILANPDMESVDNDVKERIADMFTDLWQGQVDKAVNRVIDNYTLQLDRAQRRQAGEALNKSRSKVIQHLNLGVLSNDAFIRILGEKFGIKMEMTKEERKHIESLLATLQDESLPKNKRNQASDDLASALMQYTKVGWSARLSLFWAMSVLAGWNTMLAIGMSFMNGANIILVRTPIGILSKMAQGDFKGALDVTFDSLNDMKRYLEAFPEAVDRAWGYITSGKVDLLEAEAAAPDRLFKSWDSLAKYRKVADQMVQDPKMLVRWMGTFMRMIGRIMTALDGFNTIVTKRGHLSMAVRLVAPDKEAFDRIIAKGSIEHYRQMLLASDPYFANMTPEKRRLLNSTAESMMYQAMNEEGAKLENADFYASESAFTMDPSGIGGMIYGAIKKAEETSKSFAERNLAEKRLEAQGADRLSLENAKLATAYITHFLAYNAVNYVGLRFARFAANKFNQGLSFIPFLGLTRFWEKSNSRLVDRQEAFTEMIYRNQAVGAVFAILGVMLIRALDEEPDDEKRGWFINGGLENVPTAQRRQLQEGGKLQYRLGVKINGRWLVFSYQNWPWSQLFSALGSTSDMIRFSPEKWREKGTSDILLSVAASGLTSTLDLPALQGLGTVLGRSISSSDPAEDFWTNIGAASANWVGGFIPKPLMDLDYILDSNRRKYTTIWEKTAGVVPFYRRYVGEDYYNILGDPIKRNALPGSREFLLGPTEPAYKILGALNSRDIWLTPANAEQRMVGKGRNRRRLTQQEADAYSLETGKAYKAMILRYGPRALQMSPERARAFLSDKADEVRDRVLMKVYRGYRSRPSLTESR